VDKRNDLTSSCVAFLEDIYHIAESVIAIYRDNVRAIKWQCGLYKNINLIHNTGFLHSDTESEKIY
jgi:hypothetical protein